MFLDANSCVVGNAILLVAYWFCPRFKLHNYRGRMPC